MAEERLPEFTSRTVGADFLGAIEEIFALDRRERKDRIKNVAEVNAASLLNGPVRVLLEGLFEEVPSSESRSTQHVATRLIIDDSLWLAEILASVSPDEVKKESVRAYLTKSLERNLPAKLQERFLETIDPLLDEEFKKVKRLKQSYYYRNRSVGAIQKFLTSTPKGKALLAAPVTSNEKAKAWLEQVQDAFLAFEFGEKFTRNSYISEWDAFLHDALPSVAPEVKDEKKTFATRIRTSLSTNEESLDRSPRVTQAYRELSPYVVSDAKRRVDLEIKDGAFEFKAVKGEGLYAYYKPKKESLALIKDIEARILAASFDEDDLPDISTQVIDTPGLLLVIKCLGKPDRAMIMRFEEFVRRAVGR